MIKQDIPDIADNQILITILKNLPKEKAREFLYLLVEKKYLDAEKLVKIHSPHLKEETINKIASL